MCLQHLAEEAEVALSLGRERKGCQEREKRVSGVNKAVMAGTSKARKGAMDEHLPSCRCSWAGAGGGKEGRIAL